MNTIKGGDALQFALRFMSICNGVDNKEQFNTTLSKCLKEYEDKVDFNLTIINPDENKYYIYFHDDSGAGWTDKGWKIYEIPDATMFES